MQIQRLAVSATPIDIIREIDLTVPIIVFIALILVTLSFRVHAADLDAQNGQHPCCCSTEYNHREHHHDKNGRFQRCSLVYTIQSCSQGECHRTAKTSPK